MNIATRLVEMTENIPHDRAFIVPTKNWMGRVKRDRFGHVLYSQITYQQLNRLTDRYANAFFKIGIQKGVRALVMLEPGIELAAVTFALFKAGAIPVMIDPGMGVKQFLNSVRQVRPHALIGVPLAHAVRKIFFTAFKSVQTNITIGRRWFWGGYTHRRLLSITKDVYTFPMVETSKEDTAAILFTSGSTGPAKGVVYQHGTFIAQVQMLKDYLDIKPGSVDLPTFPLFALFAPVLGMTAVIPDMDPTRPAKVNPEKIIEAIFDHSVTNMFASPAILKRIGEYGRSKSIKLPTVRKILSAGAPARLETLKDVSAMLEDEAQIYTPYGATEALPLSVIGSKEILSDTEKQSQEGKGSCVGKVLPGIETRIIKITDEPIDNWSDNLLVSPWEKGELVVRGPIVTHEYFDSSYKTILSKIKDNGTIWHRMGDIVWRDDADRLWFCGRKSHRVNTESETLYTIPCETILNQHPAVNRSALVGVESTKNGKKHPVFCVELKKGRRPFFKKSLRKELKELTQQNTITAQIDTFLFHPCLPVDVRHNSKINREELTVWATKKGKGRF